MDIGDGNGSRSAGSPTVDSNNLISEGRWVSTYDEETGISMRPVQPRYGNPVTALSTIEILLHNITGNDKLNELILIVAPSSNPNFEKKLHCFENSTKKHIGSASITQNEIKYIEQYEMLLKYEILCIDQYIPIKSVCDSAFISKLIDTEKIVLIEANTKPEPAIISLRESKIPVHMRALESVRAKMNKNPADP